MAKKGTTKYHSNIQEKDVAKQFNGRTVIGSGSLWYADSDVRNDKYLIECKTTAKDHFVVKTDIWEKIRNEAIKDQLRIPLLVVDLYNEERYVVFNPKDFEFGYVAEFLEDIPPRSFILKSFMQFPYQFERVLTSRDGNRYPLRVLPIDEFIEYEQKMEEINNG